MHAVLQTWHREGIGKNHMERLYFDASQVLLNDVDEVSKLSDDSDDDIEDALSEDKASVVASASSAQTLENYAMSKSSSSSLKTSIASSKRST